MMDQHRQAFCEEAAELLTELETSLLELEEAPEDAELIGRVFRAMHTIKGSGSMFGFDDIAHFTHEVETVFDMVRSGKMQVTKELINLTLKARDHITALLAAGTTGGTVDEAFGEEIIAGLRQLTPKTMAQIVTPPPAVSPKEAAGSSQASSYRIRFKPGRQLAMSGSNPLLLLNELTELGHARIVAQMCEMPDLATLVPEELYVFWDIILTTDKGQDAVRDVFIFVEDDCELTIDVIDDGGTLDQGDNYKKLGDILVERGDLNPQDMQLILDMQKRFGELLVEKGIVTPDKVASALAEQQHVREQRQERQVQEAASSIRVPADKLDILVNLVGELVTVQARLSQMSSGKRDASLESIAEEVERLTGELRDNALNIRMLPIGSTFSKFKRLVRDLSGELKKEIEMSTEGAETELDKTVIEKLNDPLVHLIRNSIDHGIESPADRVAAGKPRQGTVHLAAVHSGDSVLITIKDDGAGLDKEAIRAKAIERGLISAGQDLTDKEIFGQIFAPGFSTAKKVTSVSGRGVGMDVVKRAIDALRGSIDLTSTPGVGTTVTVRLPLTLAIIESLLVKIGTDCFVMPLGIVRECIELTRADLANAHGRNIANVRGHIIPYIPLRQQFAIRGDRPEIEQIVIAMVDDRQVGFVVDHVIGEHQTVIKSLGKMYKNVEGVSGATILGDGSVALILDVPHLVRGAEMAEARC